MSLIRLPSKLQPNGLKVNTMKDEYDFSITQRSKFCKPHVRLEPQTPDFLANLAEAEGATLIALFNAFLKKDIKSIGAVGYL